MRYLILFAISISTALSTDFTTYIGGQTGAQVNALATDSAGDTYVTGNNAFVTKLDPMGNIVFTKTFGQESGFAIAVDPSGNVWVAGQGGVPLVNPLQSTFVGNGTGILVKMAPDGTILYSSYFGGVLGNSSVTGIATDQNGNVYVTGWTDASDFPTTPGLPASPVIGGEAPIYGLFAAKLDPTGQKILYSTTIAGTACSSCFATTTVGSGIAVDGSGNAMVVGTGPSNSANLPVAAGSSNSGAFVFKINAAGNAVNYFSYLAPAQNITLGTRPIAADASGNAYIAGSMNNSGGISEAVAMKLNPAGTAVWATYVSGANPRIANAITVDGSDNVWLTGAVSAPNGSYVVELGPDGTILSNLSQLPTNFAGQDIAVDSSEVLHLAGSIGLISAITPAQPLAPRALSIVNAASGLLTGTVAPGEIISIYGLGLGPTTPLSATPGNGLFPTSLSGVEVLINGTPIPLLYVSASQIDAEIPSPLNGSQNGIALIQVFNESAMLPDFRLKVVNSNFAVFTNPGGSMAVINQDGTLNKMANPAKPGTAVSIWATGFGATAQPVEGYVATSAENYCASCQITLFDGTTRITETVQYAGTSPGLIDGLMQINFLIPAQLHYPDGGAWVYFAAPGNSQPIQLGWVNVSQ